MWPFSKQSARRKEIRRTKAGRGQPWFVRLWERLPTVPVLVLCGSALLAAVLVNLGGPVVAFRVGQTLPRGVTARVEFAVEDAPRTLEMRLQAQNTAENYYRLDVSLLRGIRGQLTNALQLAKEHVTDPAAFVEQAAQTKIVLDDAGRDELLRIAALTDTTEYQSAVDRFQRAVDNAISRLTFPPFQLPVLVEAVDPARRRTPINAVLVDPGDPDIDAPAEQRRVAVARLLPSNRPESAETIADAAAQAFPGPLRASMKASLIEMLRGDTPDTARPIYRYLPDESARAAEQAYARVPVQMDTYRADSLLVPAGVLDADGYRLLRAEQGAYERWLTAGPAAATASVDETPEELAVRKDREDTNRLAAARARSMRLWSTIGFAALVLLVVAAQSYHFSFRRRDFKLSRPNQLLLAGTLLAVLGCSRVLYVWTAAPYYAVGLQALAAALLTIVMSRGPVLALSTALALVLTLASRQGVGYFLVLLATSMAIYLGLRDIRSRGKIVAVGAGAALVALATTMAVGLIDGQTIAFTFWQRATLAAGTTLAAAFVIEGVLPGIERLFRVATAMTLLEWGDASKPALRALAAEAPGTYNHSLLVGTLAEAAAEAVGGNGLLARTAAYYHDIGKIAKPEYFAENKSLGTSRHDRLSPAMSHLIIIGHVKDGIEMAREFGVPECLHSFIPEHHGTTLVQYFYHAASQQRKPGDREISDVEFRYPGPKPQSKEAAILMLCDGVEGAVRAMPEPTPNRIEDTVTKIARDRMMDGQFDECDLTFRELETIERSLVKSLSALYHSRIAYPSSDDKKTAEPKAS